MGSTTGPATRIYLGAGITRAQCVEVVDMLIASGVASSELEFVTRESADVVRPARLGEAVCHDWEAIAHSTLVVGPDAVEALTAACLGIPVIWSRDLPEACHGVA